MELKAFELVGVTGPGSVGCFAKRKTAKEMSETKYGFLS